jgi:hypothetical protein
VSERQPSVGRIVHYVLEAGPNQGEHRPALIVSVRGDTPDAPVNLQVFVDGTNDYYPNQGPEPLTLWRTSKLRDDSGTFGTWHWPERV